MSAGAPAASPAAAHPTPYASCDAVPEEVFCFTLRHTPGERPDTRLKARENEASLS